MRGTHGALCPPNRWSAILPVSMAIYAMICHMAKQRTLNVSLTPQLAKFVESLVRSGRYASASEVLRDALRAIKEREAERAARLREIRRSLAEADRDIAEGRVVTSAEVVSEVRKRLKRGRRVA